MSKPSEQRYPSGPAKVGEQKPGRQSDGHPYYKATTILPQDRAQGPNPDAAKATAADAGKPGQEADKS